MFIDGNRFIASWRASDLTSNDGRSVVQIFGFIRQIDLRHISDICDIVIFALVIPVHRRNLHLITCYGLSLKLLRVHLVWRLAGNAGDCLTRPDAGVGHVARESDLRMARSYTRWGYTRYRKICYFLQEAVRNRIINLL